MEIALGYDAFWSSVEQLRDAAAELDQQRTAIAGEVDSLLDSGWRGAAAAAFAEAWDEWLIGADEVGGGRGALAAAVGLSGRLLTSSDDDASAAVDILRGRLG